MRLSCVVALGLLAVATPAAASGPEIAIREFAGGQIKKGVRTIGMGGDGATTGNYALVYRDAGTALFDEGIVHFIDNGNTFTFSAVGFTTPSFWDGAAFYVIAVGQVGNGVHVFGSVPAHGNISDTSVFLKFAKPITKTISVGLMGEFDQSQASLLPDSGAPLIDYHTSYLPSGGLGVHWQPNEQWQLGARVILSHDQETRTQGDTQVSGLARSYEYRLGVAFSPWKGTLLDAGIVGLDRSNAIENSWTFVVNPAVGAEQVLVRNHVWMRAGLDETTVTTGMSVALGAFKVDVAYLYNLGAARTKGVFGQENTSLIATIGFNYMKLIHPAK